MKELLCITIIVLVISACSAVTSVIPNSTYANTLTLAAPDKREYLWPLCGRITKNPPVDFQAANGCPVNRWSEEFSDFPLSSTFGPRRKASENFRYDFHRGIDIPTPFGTPIFAVNAGVITRAGAHHQFLDMGVTIQHYEQSAIDCDKSACMHSLYMHMSDVIVNQGQLVKKGQLIGYSGKTSFGFNHLHFEIRQSPGQHDPLSAWQRDAIHPLTVLPLFEDQEEDYRIAFSNVFLSPAGELSFIVSVSSKDSKTLAFKRLELEVYEKQNDKSFMRIKQKGDTGIKNYTPEGVPYYVNPSWYDIVLVNQQYTYKDSTLFPWALFTTGGVYQSPYSEFLPSVYTPNFHLDHASAYTKIGQFNGKLIAPEQFSTKSKNYKLSIDYKNLLGPTEFSNLCIKARAIDAKGKIGNWFGYQCH